MKILIVDDDTVSSLALSTSLELEGHQVSVAGDGNEAWELYNAQTFHVVIADWVMPGIDGLELCRRVRGFSRESYVYVILLTGRSVADDRIAGLSAGADDFLTKPFDRAELVARLGVADRILRMERALREANQTIERSRRYEIEIGAHIQRALLMAQPPEAPTAFSFAALNIPSSQIDGDFFDFFTHDPDIVDVFIGDAMGKGVPAALVAAGAKNFILRALTKLLQDAQERVLPCPAAIVQHAHDGLAREFMAIGSFVTLCYIRLDARNAAARFVDCGHTKTIHWDSRQHRAKLLRGGNFPIGFVDDELYSDIEVPLSPGDLFCLYSDGVTEASSASGELFGVERLLTIISENCSKEPASILLQIREAIQLHTGQAELDDDFTCVLIRVIALPKPWEMLEAEFPNRLDQLADIRAFVASAAEDCGLTRKSIEELQIAAHEATTNAIVHGLGDRPHEMLRFVAERAENGIRLTLVYHGEPFEPREVVSPDLSEPREGGFGLYIIQGSLTDVKYSYTPEGENRVTMMKI